MRVKLLLEIEGETSAEEIAVFNKGFDRIEEIGLSLAEAKDLLGRFQRRVVEAQVARFVTERQSCQCCGRPLRAKGWYPISFRTPFGDVEIGSPRFYSCRCRPANGKTFSPLTTLFRDHVAPELLYLETKWASLVSYDATAGLLKDVLPIDTKTNAATIRNHLHKVAARSEAELGEEHFSFIDGCPAQWKQLPVPEGPIVVGIDGGFVRDRDDRKTHFEVVVGKSVAEDRADRYFGLVQCLDEKPKRRLHEILRTQGLQMNQEITFLTDGADNVRELAVDMSPCAEHFLDWFHITMRLTVLGQYAKGLAHHDMEEAERILETLERTKWYLWNGNCREALLLAEDLVDDLVCMESDYPNLKKFTAKAEEFYVYIERNADGIPNYGERWRYGERISTAFVESTVNVVVGKRFAKKQQMQWSRKGAHLLLQTRTGVLDGTLRPMFERWYPALAANDQTASDMAEAA
jgi:hypothetical protein